MSGIPTDLPTYIQNENQENYNEEFNQTLRKWLSSNGFAGIPQLTTAQITAIAPSMNDGAMWYCTDNSPPVYVGLISGSLVQFTTSSFP